MSVAQTLIVNYNALPLWLAISGNNMKKPKIVKMIISKTLDSDLDFDGRTLEDVTSMCSEYRTQYGTNYDKLYLDYDYDGRLDRVSINLMGAREETDEEYALRTSTQAAQQAVYDDHDRATYLRLKAKFEPKDLKEPA